MNEHDLSLALHTASIEMVTATPALDENAIPLIQQMLQTPRQSLAHGACFTGRPATWLYNNAQYIVKVRTEYRFRARDARRWIERTVALEQRLQVHHPEKRWFILHSTDVALIANITPLLSPLHQRCEQCSPADLEKYLTRLLTMYVGVAASCERRLDEGLSNFALTSDETLYYVDDDLYSWDQFLGLVQGLGTWVRALTGMTEASATTLGKTLGALLEEHFHDRHTARVVAGLVRRLPLGNEAQKHRREAFLRGLEPAKLPRLRTSTVLTDEPMAVLADIHANAPALQAVLAAMQAQGVRQALVLGDLIGYGPHPHEVIELVRAHSFTLVKGNHEYAIVEQQFKLGFSAHGKHVAEWTRTRLSADELRWLDELPLFLQHNNWLAIHGAPQDEQCFFAYVYQTTYESNLDNLAARQLPICFHGHSHVAGVYFRNKIGRTGLCKDAEQSLEAYRHCLVNPGSVGQPRENAGSAARFAIFDPQTQRLSLQQVAYDVEATVQDMLAHGLPTVLAERLRQGI